MIDLFDLIESKVIDYSDEKEEVEGCYLKHTYDGVRLNCGNLIET
jgi:hypothetical protein